MNQSVIAFSNATARSSAITSPVEGMITYLEDSNSYQSWDGSAWVGLVPQSGNAIINGAFDIWQRGTSFAGTSFAYTADRVLVDTSSVVSRSTDVPAGIGVAYSLRHTGATATISNRIPIELNRLGATAPFDVGTTWTLSFYAKASASRDVAVSIAFRAAGPIGTAEGSVLANSVAGTMTGTWQRFTRTFTIPSVSLTSSNNLTIQISSSAGTSADFFFTGLQLEAGPVATPFRRNANSIQGELAACQRYYVRLNEGNGNQLGNLGAFLSSTVFQTAIALPTSMRVTPTSLDFASISVFDIPGGVTTGAAALTLASAGTSIVNVRYTHGSGIFTQGRTGYFFPSPASFIGFSAEL
jgi:hypothetical protein